jgi:hypothetical protein
MAMASAHKGITFQQEHIKFNVTTTAQLLAKC